MPSPGPWHVAARWAATVAVLLAACLVAGCGSKVKPAPDRPAAGPVSAPAGVRPRERLGRAEGRLRLVTRPGVVQDGRGESGLDWVSGFQQRTGCRVSVTTVKDSGALAAALASGRYDGGALTGDVTVPLIRSGAIAPVSTALLPPWDDVFADLRTDAAELAAGRIFAVPVDRAVNEIIWRRDRLPGTIRSSSALFDPAQAASYGGRLFIPDDPMLIADAAVYAVKKQPDLAITNPFELDRDQFAAATSVLYSQKRYVGDYFSQPVQLEDALRDGRALIGYGPHGVAERLESEDPPVKVAAAEPSEGTTGYADSWAVATRAKHPSCMYRWIAHLLSPRVNALVAQQAGAAPANRRVCALNQAEQDRCDDLHAADAGYWKDVALWRTPTRACGDDRRAVCRTYGSWAHAWDTLIR